MLMISYCCLALAMLLCFWPGLPRTVPSALVAIACAIAFAAGLLTVDALPWLLGIASFAVLHAQLQRMGHRWAARSTLLVLSGLLLALAMHKLPGFNNPLLLSAVHVSPDAIPFTLFANFDKGLAGAVLLLVLWPLSQYPQGNWQSPHRGSLLPPLPPVTYGQLLWRGFWPLFFLTFLSSEWLGVTFGFLTWDPKFPPYTLMFLAVNLFLTCVAEELFFRGLLQTSLQRYLAARQLPLWPAALLIGILFGVAHLAGGWPYAIAVSVAGTGYGLMYLRSGRIEVAILGHFALNALHFLLFSYPMLAS